MFYVDSQRTLTRRESSLITNDVTPRSDFEKLLSTRSQSTTHIKSESGVFLEPKPRVSVRKEIITSLFESMLNNIIESWEVIEQRRYEVPNSMISNTNSELGSSKKKKLIGKHSKTKESQSKMKLNDSTQNLIQVCWWTAPDERAIIRFKNGNVYEGNISMKCMHGEGRYQWTDGTVFLGSFRENEIKGRGKFQWKDDTWYEGDFAGNLRHGKGLYVDSLKQQSYYGGWHYGTKHGEGIIYYDETFKNSYDGEWDHNVRNGFGSREYCAYSGYKGEWDTNVREGKGLMIWPNHDFYKGEWKNGVMCGYGIYVWDTYCNKTMSCPSLCMYKGFWQRGTRNGFGVLNLGLGLGSFYRGEFVNNKKHGAGEFVTNNGLVLHHKHLFTDDNIGTLVNEEKCELNKLNEPYKFNICDSSVGLIYHIEQAIKNIDKQGEIRTKIVNDFIENNKQLNLFHVSNKEVQENITEFNFEDLINFEMESLRKSLRCYESKLKNIYYQYATVCNTEDIHFSPVLIRLYLWQLYYDCNINDKGLTLFEIDKLFHENPEWLSKSPHNPFDKIYFWQFQHSLITVASKLYAKRQLPLRKPDTMLADAFRVFMENDILPGVGRKRGKLVGGYGNLAPLKSLYKLYDSLGEPCTIRTFICSVREAQSYSQAHLTLMEDKNPILGRNAYILDDEITYTSDNPMGRLTEPKINSSLKLFNISNLSTRTILRIFSNILPKIYHTRYIMDINIEITFYEFFEAFVTCIEESIHLTDEEIRLQERLSLNNYTETQTIPKSNKK